MQSTRYSSVHAGRSVNPQQVVQGDLYQGSEDLGQQAGNPQGQNPPGEPNVISWFSTTTWVVP